MDLYHLSQQDLHFLEEKLAENPEIMAQRDSSHRLLLHWASLSGRQALVEYILNNSTPDIDATDDTLSTPLILATLGGHLEIVKLLAARGANINAKKQGGHSALQYAVSKNHKMIVEFFIESGVDVNCLDERQDSALHRAASLGRTEIGRILINNGSDVNCQNRESNTPLHLALEDEQLEFAFLLLDNGADHNLQNRSKQTALDVCKANIKKQVLEKYGKNESN